MVINFWSGFLAECTSCVLWVPIDVIKERLQVQGYVRLYSYKNSLDAFRQIVAQESYLGLYRAYGATVLAFGPQLGISLSLYEKIKKTFGWDNINFF